MLVLVASALVLVCAVVLVTSMMEYNDRLEEKKRLEAQKEALLEENEEKKDILDAPLDKEEIEDIARDELGYANPGDVIIHDGNSKDTSTDTSEQTCE